MFEHGGFWGWSIGFISKEFSLYLQNRACNYLFHQTKKCLFYGDPFGLLTLYDSLVLFHGCQWKLFSCLLYDLYAISFPQKSYIQALSVLAFSSSCICTELFNSMKFYIPACSVRDFCPMKVYVHALSMTCQSVLIRESLHPCFSVK